jgi:hypothetical protein
MWLFVLFFACGDDAAPDAGAPRDAAIDSAIASDAGSSSFACTEADPRAPAAEPVGPYFADVSIESGVGTAITNGFGRVVVVDVDGDGHDDVVATPTHDGPHTVPADDFAKLVLRSRGDGTFEDFTAQSGLAAARVGLMVFADVDSDGDQDMFGGTIEGQGLGDRGIWLNDAGRFTRVADAGLGLDSLACGSATCTPAEIGATFFDLDRDGVLDLYTGGWFWSDGATPARYSPPPRDRLYLGNGDGTFRDVSTSLPAHAHPLSGITNPMRFGRAAMGVSAGDYDNDGDLDVFVANYGAGRPALSLPSGLTCEPPRYWDQDLLWRNDGGALVEVGMQAGVAATMRGPSGITMEEPLVIGDECPAEVRGTYTSPIGGNGFTSQFGDFDNDGDLDLVVGAIAHPDYVQSDPTLVFVNQGPPDYRFEAAREELGLRYREDEKHVAMVDVDADGLLDVAITGFRNPAENTLDLYLQTGEHRFELADPATTGVADRAQETIVWLDYDRDGDLDLYVAEEQEPARLFRNTAADVNHVLVIELEADGIRDATGARVTIETSAGTQLREVTSGNGHYNPQPPRAQYFGLGGDRCADDVTIRWPDGTVQNLGAVAADRILTVAQNGAISAQPIRD